MISKLLSYHAYIRIGDKRVLLYQWLTNTRPGVVYYQTIENGMIECEVWS